MAGATDEIKLPRRVELRDDEGIFVDLYVGDVVAETWAVGTESRPSRLLAMQLLHEAFIGVESKLDQRDRLLRQAQEWIDRGTLKGVGYSHRKEWSELVDAVFAGVDAEPEAEAPSAPHPELPDWAAADGQQCLKQWIPMGVIAADIDVCLLEAKHESKMCRTARYSWRDQTNALFQGQLTREG